MDVELLLAHVLEKDRAYIYTWPDRELTGEQLQQFDQLLQRRAEGRPIAHLLGQREFWGLPLDVNDSTLIPRPDTELLIEIALQLSLPTQARVLDLGTGTGAIALALASERHHWQLQACDSSPAAVQLAQSNCRKLNLNNVEVIESNWFSALGQQQYDLIVSNPPYIAPADPHLAQGDVRFEPRSALVAAANGLADIDTIINRARDFLRPGGWLMIEHGYDQAESVRSRFHQCGFSHVATHKDLGANDRLTLGQWSTEGDHE